jgi:ABC-type multidrug transport system ATPase subunit
MTSISLTEAGKRFNKDWIFRNLTFHFEAGNKYALVGNNGSGKSTLLQIIAGYSNLSKGSIEWKEADATTIYEKISIAAPYLELVEEFTAQEQFTFHTQFKSISKLLSIQEMIDAVGLTDATHKQIRYYSSGMKQRLKLALAIFSNTPILLLDEPCSNLDKDGYTLYKKLIQQYAMHKLIIVGSNDSQEYEFCETQINLMDYKS